VSGARKRLKAAVAGVAAEQIVEPVERELQRLSSFSDALQRARGESSKRRLTVPRR
jgi:hypothetical protein